MPPLEINDETGSKYVPPHLRNSQGNGGTYLLPVTMKNRLEWVLFSVLFMKKRNERHECKPAATAAFDFDGYLSVINVPKQTTENRAWALKWAKYIASTAFHVAIKTKKRAQLRAVDRPRKQGIASQTNDRPPNEWMPTTFARQCP